MLKPETPHATVRFLDRVDAAERAGDRRGGLSYFYNLDNYRKNQDHLAAELRAMAKNKPLEIGGCEAVGNDLPDLPGYRLLHSTKNLSRANVFAYVRDDLVIDFVHYIDRSITWPRTEGPGRHEARADLVYGLGHVQRIWSHQPPRGIVGVKAAQAEGIRLLGNAMAPWRDRHAWAERTAEGRRYARLRPRGLGWDSNARVYADNGAHELAVAIGGDVHGGPSIDNWVTRGIRVRSCIHVHQVRGVPMLSDHKEAVVMRWDVPAPWLIYRTDKETH